MEGIGGRKRKVGNEIIVVSKIKIKMVHFILLITFLVALAKKKMPGKSNLWSQGFALAHNWIVRSIKGIIAAL